ncbi:uncharacterized protein KGF55_000875 [Candida pseudojiufengensis]|uniref:uncharacterized protein n=1 Tax=Candida pseudojiufengensis TaxID=497109 RepID=UPI0022259251|nr:uncharacterized protein KGF55_000875 [Candida pseudojiufengensis]KAI5966566.1 hypothetical protein KGF55_000875 [Candida pseudojiufengensis]
MKVTPKFIKHLNLEKNHPTLLHQFSISQLLHSIDPILVNKYIKSFKMLSRFIKSSGSASIVSSKRLFSISSTRLVDGSIGKDSFSEKERAQENVYIKKQEEAQLKKLKAKLQEQKDTIDKLEEEIKNNKNGKK